MTHRMPLLSMLGLVAAVALAPAPAPRAENMDPDGSDEQYAWGENVGWLNLEPSGDGGPGVQIDDFSVSGWIWGENIGWISLSCLNQMTCGAVDYGVDHDGQGNLSGDAWGENVGWIRFSHAQGNVSVDPADGVLHGYAWGENIGWIQFGSATGPFPYRVRTAWNCSPPPPLPSGALDLVVSRAGGWTLQLSWNPVADATGYDIVHGDLIILRGPPGGDFASSTLGCIADNETTTELSFDSPPLDTAVWYLVRPVNCGGSGTYDSGGGAQAAPRDAGIDGSGLDCLVP